MKVILAALIIAVFICGSCFAAEFSNIAPMKSIKALTGQEPLPDGNAVPYQPGAILDSPGIIVGTTYYDYQTNGSTGNRVAICSDGSKYFNWMYMSDWPNLPRHVYHNWMDADGNLNPNAIDGQVNCDAGAGYTNLDIIYNSRGCFTYHSSGGTAPTYVTVSVDNQMPGMGLFEHYNPPDELFPQTQDSPGRCYWPYVCVDRSDNIHVVMTEYTDRRLSRMAYCNSTDDGTSWGTLQFVDTVMVTSSVIDASPVSDRVALAYSRTTDTTTQWRNDIYYVVSDDGTLWNFRYGRNNITNYADDDDSLFAYTDLDIIFDYNDNIHIVWTDQGCSLNYVYFRTNLKHWDEESGEIEEIMHHPDSLWTIENIEGVFNRPISKMNLGVSGSDSLFCTFTYFDTSDVSAGGFANGEIYLVYKYNGAWYGPQNLTNSPSNGCIPGECDSDHWSTLADVVDDSLHILYINDKDAGGIPQTEGTPTENPVMYLTCLKPYIPGIDEDDNHPMNFSLSQNYPNPFNSRTVINYSLLKPSQVQLAIYDIFGRHVETLVDESQPAGCYEAIWNADGAASGIYYYKIRTGGKSATKQMVLLK
ncbi:MAG: T9SS type A sorting domain-containing protein [candidate division Zixibacteria bacterium]|nr:T9SS type A sorting domain-containing protein [candidate division Zixibacteria bacterium]